MKQKLLFLDLETTGLSPKYNDILEVYALVVDQDLEELDSFHAITYQDIGSLSAMDEWCTNTHTKSGLVAAVINSTTTLDEADERLALFVHKNFGADKARLAGNSVHFDLSFMKEHMPRTVGLLSHQIADVSGMTRTLKMLGVDVVTAGDGMAKHRAKDDVRQSVDQLHLIRSAVLRNKT